MKVILTTEPIWTERKRGSLVVYYILDVCLLYGSKSNVLPAKLSPSI